MVKIGSENRTIPMINSLAFSNLRIYSINNKNVYVVDKHQFVFPVWANHSITKNQKYDLVTFDFHTDTKPAFNRYSISKKDYPLKEDFRKSFIKKLAPRNLGSIIEVTHKLANDEHINAAIELGYIAEAHVINLSDNFDGDAHISYYLVKNYFDSEFLRKNSNPHENELKKFWLNRLEDEYINDAKFKVPSNPFILDFDLDYFPTRESLKPKNRDTISNLISKAQIITIAREEVFFQEKCVQLGFSVTEAETLLLNLIETYSEPHCQDHRMTKLRWTSVSDD